MRYIVLEADKILADSRVRQSAVFTSGQWDNFSLCRQCPKANTLLEKSPILATEQRPRGRIGNVNAQISVILDLTSRFPIANHCQFHIIRARGKMEPVVGIEPTTYGLRNR